jgi:hypothetical protein
MEISKGYSISIFLRSDWPTIMTDEHSHYSLEKSLHCGLWSFLHNRCNVSAIHPFYAQCWSRHCTVSGTRIALGRKLKPFWLGCVRVCLRVLRGTSTAGHFLMLNMTNIRTDINRKRTLLRTRQ